MLHNHDHRQGEEEEVKSNSLYFIEARCVSKFASAKIRFLLLLVIDRIVAAI